MENNKASKVRPNKLKNALIETSIFQSFLILFTTAEAGYLG